jgi:Tol biopolymer transport system component
MTRIWSLLFGVFSVRYRDRRIIVFTFMEDSPAVFLCHSSKDHEIACAILASLERCGIRCWIAPRDILEGEVWEEAIIRGITGSQVVLCLLSATSNDSRQVQREIHYACEVNDKRVIPVRLEDMRLSGSLAYHLGRLQWIDAVSRPIDRHLWKIIDRVNAVLGMPATEDSYAAIGSAPHAAYASVASVPAVETRFGARQANEGPQSRWPGDGLHAISGNGHVHQGGAMAEAAVPTVVPANESWVWPQNWNLLSRKWLFPAIGLCALALAATAWFIRRPLPVLSVTGDIKITNDSDRKELAGADWNRLYFTRLSPYSIAQVAITGGEIAEIPLTVQSPYLLDVSPDGGSLLVIDDGGAMKITHPLWSVGSVGGSPRYLGEVADAAFSADGKMIAYSAANGDLWLMQNDGTGARKLASVGGIATRIAWSPDSSTIRFTRVNQLWEVLSNGAHLRQLLPNWTVSNKQCCGKWTPDGRYFVFLSGGPFAPEGQEIWALDERRAPFDASRSAPFQLKSGPIRWGWPIPSKDGKKIFARGIILHGELVRFDPSTHNYQPFLGLSAQGATFSKDGRSVAYVSYPNGILWRANRDGSNPIQLTAPPIDAMLPRWSPDGAEIVFVDRAAPVHKIYRVSSEGGTPEQVLPEDTDTESSPTWSADGRKIVFASQGGKSSRSAIHILNLEDHQITTLATPVAMTSPRWSPDGRSIAALSWDSLSLSIYDLATQKWSTLAQKGPFTFPEWSRDSQSIWFVRQRGDVGIYRIRASGGPEEEFVDLKHWHWAGWFQEWMGLDDTDAPLLLRDIGSDDIYALTLSEK